MFSKFSKYLAQRKVLLSRLELYRNFPTLYRVLDYCKFVETNIPQVETLAVFKRKNGTFKIQYNPTFINSLNSNTLIGVQLHEIMHIVLGHLTARKPIFKSESYDKNGMLILSDPEDISDMKIWNLAMDLAINPLISDFLIDENGKKIGSYPDQPQFNLPMYKNAEFYFEELKKKQKELKDEFLKTLDNHLFSIINSDNSDSNSETTNNNPIPIIIKPEEIEKQLNNIKKQLNIENKPGNINSTSQITRQYFKVKKTPIWMRSIRRSSTHSFNFTIHNTKKRPNRRFDDLFPGKIRREISNLILVAVDVSGSIDMDKFDTFMKHVNGMTKYCIFDLIFFNTDIVNLYNIIRYRKNQKIKVPKGGGTSFECVMNFWNRNIDKYDVLYIFTDGQASYTTPPKYEKSVNWILYSDSNYGYESFHGKKYPMNKTECN